MKKYLFFLLTLTQLFSASLEHITINYQDFSFVKEQYDVYDSKGEVLKIYREERNKNLIFVLRLTLDDSTGGCSSKSLQKGIYQIEGSTITLYSLWTRRGQAYNSPYGARIQKYEVQSNGVLKFLEGKIYIEETKKGHDNESGMEYLFTAPKNDAERASLEDYVKSMEHQYKGQFLFRKDALALIAEVKKTLKSKRKKGWKILNIKGEK